MDRKMGLRNRGEQGQLSKIGGYYTGGKPAHFAYPSWSKPEYDET
jgi:hypothetical protein